MIKRIKALLVALHLYLGIALCLLFLVWFVSGIAMVYYRTPVLGDSQRIASVPLLTGTERAVLPSAVESLAADWPNAEGVRIGLLHGRPLWRWRTANEGWRAAWADDGAAASFDGASLLEDARRWLQSPDASFDGAYEADNQWTYFTALRPHYPVLRYSTGGLFHRDVYFSSRTGEPVAATTAFSRTMYYLGPGLHYFSFYPIRNRDALWRGLVNWSSGIGTAVCLFGLILGVWRLRWDAVGTNRQIIPYKKFWMYWHHWVGLAFGVFATTFVLSGLFSMNPGKMFPETTVPKEILRGYVGERPAIGSLPALPDASALGGASELAYAQVGGKPLLVANAPGGQRKLFVTTTSGDVGITAGADARVGARPGTTSSSTWTSRPPYSDSEIRSLVQPLLPAPLAAVTRLDRFDTYYYARKEREQPLPALRLKLGDSADTWFYADPATSALFLKSDNGTRARRWLYNGLHSFDLQSLLNRPMLWTIVIWGLSIIGVALSVTSTMVSWRWLQRWAERRRRRAMQAAGRSFTQA